MNITYDVIPANKFPYTVCCDCGIEYTRYLGQNKLHDNHKKWLKENVGRYRKDWMWNEAFFKGGKRIFYTDLMKSISRDDATLGYQYGFKSEQDAMKFKLIIGLV